MKIICIKGGLGNQMFEYCRYRELKRRASESVWMYYDRRRTKQHGGVMINSAFDVKLPKQNPTVWLMVQVLKVFRKMGIFKRLYDDTQDNCILIDDYSQDKRFIVRAKEYLKFNVTQEDGFAKQITAEPYPVSIHVRRGDYLQAENERNFGVCPAQYFVTAAEMIRQQHRDARFFIFSDDIEWAKNNLDIQQSVFVEHQSAAADHTDMYLMTLCKGHVLSNSTFSFWGAMLAEHPDGITIYPKKWFAEASWTVPNIFPDSWQSI